MNKKYMDFVPAKAMPSGVSGKRSTGQPKSRVVSQRTVVKTEIKRTAGETPSTVVQRETRVREGISGTADTFSIKNEPEYGVIEDFRPKFVKTEVEKRPLSRSHFAISKTELSEIKSQNMRGKSAGKVLGDSAELEKSGAEDALKIPKSPFINHGKVAKRPLSKNVYEKKIEPTKEEQKEPITIIDGSEKGQKSGLVVTIILTILLGAVAGTIAFLLLPK